MTRIDIDPLSVHRNLRAMRTIISVILIAAVLAGSAFAQEPTPLITTGVSSYSLLPGDVIVINVWGQEAFSGNFQIDEDGRILYPILGEIDTRNVTVAELRDTIRTGLETLFNNPFLTVTPQFRISVLGHVLTPGLYTIDPTLTAIDVVAMAGGPSRNGDLNDIRIRRRGETSSVAYGDEGMRGRTLHEVGVRSGDQIYVQRRWFTRDDLMLVLQIAQVALTIAIFISTT
jgi:protein involved in polysaccharide export with SLBB domain